MAEIAKSFLPGCFKIGVRDIPVDFQRIETAAMHRPILIAQHVAHGANFAVEAQPVLQQTGIGIGPSVGELGEFQRDNLKPREIVAQIGGRFAGGEADAQAGIAPGEAVFFRLPAGQGDNNRPVFRQIVVVTDMGPVVGRDLAVFKQPCHRASP